MASHDAIIVGGGHNGLVAAFYLARAGQRVLLLERRGQVGGPASTIEFFPGYRGAITNSPGSLEPRIVADMELERHGLRWARPDPSVIMPFPDGRFFVGWRDQARLKELIARDFSKHDAEAYFGIFRFFDDFARRIRVSLFEPPPTLQELVGRLRTAEDEADFATIFFGSIRDFLERRLESDAIRTSIAMLSTGGAAVAPSTPGTPMVLLQRPMSMFSSTATGAHDPRNQVLRGSTGLPLGGMGSITEAMRRAVEALGVEIRTDVEVAGITVDGSGAARGVHLANGDEHAAPIVLSSLHPVTTLLRMVEQRHVPEPLLARLRAIGPGAATFKVVLALDEPPHFAHTPPGLEDAYASCQIRICPDMRYLEQQFRDFVDGRCTMTPRLMGLVPTMTDPTMAPEGRHMLSVNAWYFRRDLKEGDWDGMRDVVGEAIVKILADYIPSLKRSIVARRFYSPVDFEREFGLVAGNFAHLDMTPAQMFGLRPVAGLSQYRTPVRGLYLCGSGCWPGGTVTGLPGHNAAQQVLRDLSGATAPQLESA
jgi:phytoene dehydrogenase-like protein